MFAFEALLAAIECSKLRIDREAAHARAEGGRRADGGRARAGARAQGLHYLLGHSSLGPEFNRGVVIGVYVFGGILFVFLAIAHFFTKD